jgi:hypothetical protein
MAASCTFAVLSELLARYREARAENLELSTLALVRHLSFVHAFARGVSEDGVALLLAALSRYSGDAVVRSDALTVLRNVSVFPQAKAFLLARRGDDEHGAGDLAQWLPSGAREWSALAVVLGFLRAHMADAALQRLGLQLILNLTLLGPPLARTSLPPELASPSAEHGLALVQLGVALHCAAVVEARPRDQALARLSQACLENLKPRAE